jgi:hypothetical protein
MKKRTREEAKTLEKSKLLQVSVVSLKVLWQQLRDLHKHDETLAEKRAACNTEHGRRRRKFL